MPRLHRNNAAEWVMAIALSPLRWIARLTKKGRKNSARTEPSGSAAGPAVKKPTRSVMIEGLPPRTMN